ncbi:hypothetical protein LTR28_010615 [Elasticomyces elasticus]|nr:hypothetical protein LTR28_010615 [Elasticomyces elasticus]
MYLGNLSHANNSELLCELGIGQVLSIGEPVSWSEEVKSVWGRDKLMFIEQVQDNGVDPLTEVMDKLELSFPKAYCYVRARRLNVIIQPHLRFAYELLKWEEAQCLKRGKPLKRELEWATIAREIAAMNKPYARQQ